MGESTQQSSQTPGDTTTPPPPTPTPPQVLPHTTPHPNTDSVPLWCGNDPSYPVFTFIRRVEDAVSHSSLTDSEKIAFLRGCMSCDTRTPAGAALEDDFYSSCTNFKAFCNQLIKEFACSDNDPCLASLTNMTHLIRTNSDTLSPRDAAGLAGRFRTEMSHALSHSTWLDGNDMMSKSHFLSLLSYTLYTSLLTPQASQITSELPFLPQTSIHDLKISAEAKLRARAPTHPHTTPPPSSTLPPAPSGHRISPPAKNTSFSSSHHPPPRPAPPPTRTHFHSSQHQPRSLICYSCNTPGHHFRDCRVKPSTSHPRSSHSSAHTKTHIPWCHYHQSTLHSASECRVLQAQRDTRSPNFR